MTKEVKFFEVRDRLTFIPVMAVRVSGEDGYLARRAGFQNPLVYLVHLTAAKANYDAYSWDNRTMISAHEEIEAEWTNLVDGEVIDVEFIRGETKVKKRSERETHGDHVIDTFEHGAYRTTSKEKSV